MSQQLPTPKMNTSLSNIFDIELQQTDMPLVDIKADARANDINSLEKQREYVKSNLVKLIERGMTAVSDLNIIANGTEASKDFKVLSDMITVLVASNVELMNIEVAHKPKLDIANTLDQTNVTNNNTVFVGSTKDLSTYIKSLNTNNILVK